MTVSEETEKRYRAGESYTETKDGSENKIGRKRVTVIKNDNERNR